MDRLLQSQQSQAYYPRSSMSMHQPAVSSATYGSITTPSTFATSQSFSQAPTPASSVHGGYSTQRLAPAQVGIQEHEGAHHLSSLSNASPFSGHRQPVPLLPMPTNSMQQQQQPPQNVLTPLASAPPLNPHGSISQGSGAVQSPTIVTSRGPSGKSGEKFATNCPFPVTPPTKDSNGKFPCPYCSKTYLHAKHLKRHLLRHTGDRPYQCPLCRDSFSRSDILKRHFMKCQIRRGNPTQVSHLSHTHAAREAAAAAQLASGNTQKATKKMATNPPPGPSVKAESPILQSQNQQPHSTSATPISTFPEFPRQNTSSSCDECARLKARCDFNQPCQRCASRNIECTYLKSMKRHSVAAMPQAQPSSMQQHHHSAGLPFDGYSFREEPPQSSAQNATLSSPHTNEYTFNFASHQQHHHPHQQPTIAHGTYNSPHIQQSQHHTFPPPPPSHMPGMQNSPRSLPYQRRQTIHDTVYSSMHHPHHQNEVDWSSLLQPTNENYVEANFYDPTTGNGAGHAQGVASMPILNHRPTYATESRLRRPETQNHGYPKAPMEQPMKR